MRVRAITAGVVAAALLAPASAQAATCANVATLNGLGAKVVAEGVSCRTAARVVRSYVRQGGIAAGERKVVLGYACRTTHVASSSAEQGRFRCIRGARVIRVELRS